MAPEVEPTFFRQTMVSSINHLHTHPLYRLFSARIMPHTHLLKCLSSSCIKYGHLLITAYSFVKRDVIQQKPSTSPLRDWPKNEGSPLGVPFCMWCLTRSLACPMQVQMLPLHEAPSPDGHLTSSLVRYSPKTDNQASAALFTQHPLCPTYKASRYCPNSFLLALLLICPFSFRYWIARVHYLCNVLTYSLPMTAANSLKTLKIQQDSQSLASDRCYSLKKLHHS